MNGYSKLAASIVTSSIWTESDTTRLVWITMIAIADQHGEVNASIPGLARVAGVSIPACEAALATFLAPDPYSRTKDDDGRRIQVIEGGWWMINHGKYRELATGIDRSNSNAARQKRYRDRKNRNNAVTSLQTPVTRDALTTVICQAEAEAEAEAEAKNVKNSVASLPRSQKPSIESVRLQAAKIGLSDFEADKFFDFYESNGWRVGKNPMKSWTSAMANWKRNAGNFFQPSNPTVKIQPKHERCI